MKNLIISIVMVAATIQSASAQYKKEYTRYGFAFSQFSSTSGFQPGYEAHFTVQPTNTAKVGFGLFLDNESKRISGLTITHQRMFFGNRKRLPLLQPFVLYNFIYRRTSTPEIIEKDGNIVMGTEVASYASMEHHLGMGLNINISDNIVLDCGFGYGLYLGSIKRPSAPDPITHEISGTSGSGFVFKTGVGFRF